MFLSTASKAQVTTFIAGSGADFQIQNDYMNYCEQYKIYRADISNPFAINPPGELIFDLETALMSSGNGIQTIAVKDSYLYFTVVFFPSYTKIYRLNLADLDAAPMIVCNHSGHFILDMDFYGSYLYLGRNDFYGGAPDFERLNLAGTLPGSSTLYLDKKTTALTVAGSSLYFSASPYVDGVVTNSQIYFKNMYLVSPETFIFNANGVVQDLKYFENYLYFTDAEGLKRISLAGVGVPSSAQLLLSIIDYPNLRTIDIKSYVSGQKYLYVSQTYSVNILNVLRLDLNNLTLNTQENTIIESKIYPNPANNVVHIASSSEIETINVFDISGKLILNQSLIKKDLQYDLEISNITKGTYFIHIQTSNGIQIQKLQKE